MTMGGPVQRFNLDTMSGVSPGTRTQTFQRIRLRALDEAAQRVWVLLQWYDQPASCALYLQTATGSWADTPLLTLSAPFDNLPQRLQETLHHVGWVLESCGSCAFWQRVNTATPDGLAGGCCQWAADESTIPLMLALQSSLALCCPHWQPDSKSSAVES
jgi:hypothetical protein